MWTPHPVVAVVVKADPSVNIEAVGFDSGGWPRVTTDATKSSAFFLAWNRFTSLYMPVVCSCASVHEV